MGDSVGKSISAARRRKNMTLDDLGPLVGLSRSQLSIVERDRLKGGHDAEVVVKIAEVLGDTRILMAYLEHNPVLRAFIPNIFKPLNHIRTDVAIVLGRLRKEMSEAMDAIEVMEEMFSNADPQACVQFIEIFKAKMQQVIDVKRGIEILELQLLADQIMDEVLRRQIYQEQDEKCVRKGHHIPEKVAEAELIAEVAV